MIKYVVVNGSYRPDDNNTSLVSTHDDLETAKRYCNENLAEDFGYGSFEELLEEEFPVCDTYEWLNLVYSVELETCEHTEVYKVYSVEI